MSPAPGEDATALAECVQSGLPREGLRQTRVVFTDDPSNHLLVTLQNIMPNLEMLCLDPVHLCITFEYSTYRKRTKASTCLRSILCKFNAFDAEKVVQHRTPPFNGVARVEFDHFTQTRREQILTGAMGKAKAKATLERLDWHKPWENVRDVVEAFAALPCCFPDDVDKVIPGPNRSGRQLLHTDTAFLPMLFKRWARCCAMQPRRVSSLEVPMFQHLLTVQPN